MKRRIFRGRQGLSTIQHDLSVPPEWYTLGYAGKCFQCGKSLGPNSWIFGNLCEDCDALRRELVKENNRARVIFSGRTETE